MKEIKIVAHLRIHSGKLAEFKAIVEACTKSVREKDTGTVQYDWFFNEDQTESQLWERYRDSDAILEHMANVGEKLGQLFGLVDFLSVDIYGSPSEQLLKAMEGMEKTIYTPFQTI